MLIADDHLRTRAEIRKVLESSGRFEVCADVGSAEAAVAAAHRDEPDICLMDIRMPGNGIAATAQIRAFLPGTSIVMLTVSRSDADLFDALRAGAQGYLLKGLDEQEIPLALERVLAGEATLPGNLVARLVEEFRDREERRVSLPDSRTALLTGREWDVLELMRARCSTKEIAERLFVSPTTVRSHVSSILKKLEVENRSDALSLLDSPPPARG